MTWTYLYLAISLAALALILYETPPSDDYWKPSRLSLFHKVLGLVSAALCWPVLLITFVVSYIIVEWREKH